MESRVGVLLTARLRPLRFLRCSPFDEYKVWKAQVDNGSNRGRERLNILTRTLLLRRTKAQRDSEGKPLVRRRAPSPHHGGH